MPYRYVSLALLVGFAAALSACGGGEVRINDFDRAALGANPGTVSDSYLDLKSKKNLKGITKVAMRDFQVSFVVSKGAKAGRITSVSSGALLQGPTSDNLQTLTDKIYDDFVAGLKKDGVEVVSWDQAKDGEQAKKFIADSKPTPYKADPSMSQGLEYMVFTPHGMPLNIEGFVQYGDSSHSKFAKEAGAQAALSIDLTVDFVKFKGTSGGGMASMSSKPVLAVADKGLHHSLLAAPVPTQLKLVRAEGGTAVIKLKETVETATPFGELAKASDHSLLLAGSAGGIGGISSRRLSYNVNTQPAVFEEKVLDLVAQVREMFLYAYRTNR